MSFSSSPYITTWTMGLVWGEGGGKGAGEGQDCKWNPNYGTWAPLNILLKQTVEASIGKGETAGHISAPVTNY